MKTKEERIKEYLQTVDSSKEMYTIIDFLYLMKEKSYIELPPKHLRLTVCRDIGRVIDKLGLEKYESVDSEGFHTNIYPEHVIAKVFFKESEN